MELKVNQLSKSFGTLNVFMQVNLSLHSGQVYCLMGSSGSGKTTFFRILLGLEEADSGSMEGLQGIRASAVFQENRLCESFTPVQHYHGNPRSFLPKQKTGQRRAFKASSGRGLIPPRIYLKRGNEAPGCHYKSLVGPL